MIGLVSDLIIMLMRTTIDSTFTSTPDLRNNGIPSAVSRKRMLAGVQPTRNVPKISAAVTTVRRPRAEVADAVLDRT